jgi:hypothetical protein
MSDKPTMTDEALYNEIIGTHEEKIWDTIQQIKKKHPDWFAPDPEPDPMEKFLTQFCAVCDYIVPCNAGIPFENQVYRDCQLCRDALRTYVADLHDKIESLQKAQQLKGGEK